MSSKDNHLLPIISCLVAATLWGLFWYPLRTLEQLGVSGLWASALIYTFTLIPLLPGLWLQRSGLTKQVLNLGLIGVFAGWANLGFILAVLEGNIVRVLLLFYLSPVWTVLLGLVMLDEHLTGLAWLSVLIAMIGATIMLSGGSAGIAIFNSFDIADFLAISAGFSFAVMNVLIRKTGNIPIILKMGPACLGVILLSLTGLVIHTQPVPVINATTMMISGFTGGLGMLAMTYTAQYGVTHLPVHRSAVIFLFEIVVGAISAAILANEITTAREWLGGVMVVMAAWLTAFDMRSQNRISQSK